MVGDSLLRLSLGGMLMLHMKMSLVFLCSMAFGFVSSHEEIALNGDGWMVSGLNTNRSYPAKVPGSIYTDLMRQGILDDPLFRFNDEVYRWVAKQNWSYVSEFEVTANFLLFDHVILRCEGLDTVATIEINRMYIADTNNMFRRYTFDIKDALKEGRNTIHVTFQSPVAYAKRQSEAFPYEVPPVCPSPEQRGECHANFIRKEACSFSWDWGPSFPTVGIWKDLAIEAFNGPIIRYILPESRSVSDDWELSVAVHFAEVGATSSGSISLSIPALNISAKKEIHLNSDDSVVSLKFPVQGRRVQLWWPNGHGTPFLYDMKVTFTNSQGQNGPAHDLKIGFRTIKLVQNPIEGASGLSFYFEVNQQPIFIKGSNWIPADVFQERVSRDRLENLLSSAAKANMNMLRVWGGGVYESDDFYNLADEYGILLWQDFMFACADYPANAEFLDNVRHEITHQVRRLLKHASIAIWAGNNENEWGFMAKRHTPSDPQKLKYYRDYISLTVRTIFDVVQTEDPYSRPFVPSSPSNGAETITEGWVAANPQDPHYGDVHHYDYKSDSWDWRVFPIPRFASEYGLQSWCSLETLLPVSNTEDLKINSSFCDHRQHHPQGESQMWNEISRHLKPPNNSNQTQKFIDYIYLTQINQAVGIKTEAELFRRMQDHVTPNGEGFTMGSLYWQLNDIWQAPTWSSIEYGGKWKMLHYMAQDFYAHSLISSSLNGDNLDVYLIHETPASQRNPPSSSSLKFKASKSKPKHENEAAFMERTNAPGWIVEISIYDWSKQGALKSWNFHVDKLNLTSNLIFHNNLPSMLQESECPSMQHCFLFLRASNGAESCDNWIPLSYYTDAVGLRKSQIMVSDLMQTKEQIDFSLTADAISPFVWLEAEGLNGHFSRNGFLLGHEDGRKESFTFYADQSVDLNEFSQKLVARSLMDVYM